MGLGLIQALNNPGVKISVVTFRKIQIGARVFGKLEHRISTWIGTSLKLDIGILEAAPT